MLKATLIAASLVFCGSAWADDAPAQKDTPKTTETAKTQAQPKCLSTGSRIPRKDGQCGPAFGRVYSRQDLERTGRVDAAQALRALDPAL